MNTIFDIDSVVNFKKHKGKTILQIFAGDKKGLEDNIMAIACECSPGEPLEKLSEISLQYFFHKEFIGEDVANEWLSNGRKLRVQYEGNPDYLEWCIKNIDSFVISPSAIEILETLEVVNLKNIEVTNSEEKEGHIKLEKVEYTISSYKFPDDVKKKNEDKIEKREVELSEYEESEMKKMADAESNDSLGSDPEFDDYINEQDWLG